MLTSAQLQDIVGKTCIALHSAHHCSIKSTANHSRALLMSGETVNKAQGHIDAVNRAKTERLERHSGAGTRGSPKKGGGGKGGWGSVEDDIREATKGGGVQAVNDTKVDTKLQED